MAVCRSADFPEVTLLPASGLKVQAAGFSETFLTTQLTSMQTFTAFMS
jgi:hypothetical protein